MTRDYGTGPLDVRREIAAHVAAPGKTLRDEVTSSIVKAKLNAPSTTCLPHWLTVGSEVLVTGAVFAAEACMAPKCHGGPRFVKSHEAP